MTDANDRRCLDSRSNLLVRRGRGERKAYNSCALVTLPFIAVFYCCIHSRHNVRFIAEVSVHNCGQLVQKYRTPFYTKQYVSNIQNSIKLRNEVRKYTDICEDALHSSCYIVLHTQPVTAHTCITSNTRDISATFLLMFHTMSCKKDC